jgi:hypothetical protein
VRELELGLGEQVPSNLVENSSSVPSHHHPTIHPYEKIFKMAGITHRNHISCFVYSSNPVGSVFDDGMKKERG